MPGPLPESLRRGVQEAYAVAEYAKFMQTVCALQEGWISNEVANERVFDILGWTGGKTSPNTTALIDKVVAWNRGIKRESGLGFGSSGFTCFIRDDSSQSLRPDLYKLFVQWSAPAAPGTVCFDFLPTATLVKDLNSLDAALAMMLPTLEMRDLVVYKATLKTITYPPIFMAALEALHTKAKNGIGMDNADLVKFHREQFEKQKYVGDRFTIPFAEDFTDCTREEGESGLWVKKTVSAIKMTDLDLTLPWLMEKTSLFAQYRLDIIRLIYLYYLDENNTHYDNMKKEFKPSLAGQTTSKKTAATVHNSECLGHGHRYLTQAEFDSKQAAGLKSRERAKDNFKANSREHYCSVEENTRETMQLLARCSPTMNMALREGVGEPRGAASVILVHMLWDSELGKRRNATKPHPADVAAI